MEGVTAADAGMYQCMVGQLVDFEMVKAVKPVMVEVAQRAAVSFGEEVESSGDSWVLVMGQVQYLLELYTNHRFTVPGEGPLGPSHH